jgi:hypothetical protein
MTPLALLTISLMATILMIAPLLYTQRHERKSTISHYAAKTPLIHGFYIACNIIATTSFYIFALIFFNGTRYGMLLIATSSIGYISGIIQAAIPAKGKIEKYHDISSSIMGYFMVITGVLAVLLIPQPPIISTVTKTIALCFILALPLSFIIKTKYYYRVQIVALSLFYLELFLVVISANS